MLEVTLYSYDPTAEENSFLAEDSVTVDYVSYVNSETHGAPALVAPGRVGGQNVPTVAKSGDEVFYINTSFVPAWRIKRLDD